MIKSNSKNIFLEKSKSEYYMKNKIRDNFKNLENSKKKILLKKNINNLKVLDVGCANGDFFLALNEKFKIDYTGIDIDTICIKNAKNKKYRNASFKKLDIFNKKIKKNSFDIVMIWNLFYMLPNWKKILNRACEISRKYVMFDNKIRYEGPTIIDKDLSYMYYHSSNKRNYYIVHNIYELISYFQIHELNLKNVYGYGYNLPGKTSARLPLEVSKIKIGAFLLEKSNKKIIRTGTTKESAKRKWINLNFDFPKFKFKY
tara:strand:- start:117 stop:890 length:774 start_codon:yes stop_codon:yes gene_type:complete